MHKAVIGVKFEARMSKKGVWLEEGLPLDLIPIDDSIIAVAVAVQHAGDCPA